jgi:hypothetical protein
MVYPTPCQKQEARDPFEFPGKVPHKNQKKLRREIRFSTVEMSLRHEEMAGTTFTW